MKDFVAKAIQDLPYSGIRKFFDVAAEMGDVVSLGVGEPDFATPKHVRDYAFQMIEKSGTKYTSNSGTPELRTEICRYMSDKYSLNYQPLSQVLITVGASEGIDVAMRAIINPGDEVLVVEPCFVSYKPCVIMAGGVAVPVPTKPENDFRVTVEDIKAKLTPKTKAILLSYPSNPTGAILERKDLENLAAYLRELDIIVVSDEIYSELTYNSIHHTSIAEMPGMYERTIVLNGFSKAYAMTGWRLGYACGPEELIAQMTKIHQYIIMCAPTTAQYAGIEALRNGDEGVAAMRKEYDTRRRYILGELDRIGIECFEAKGAFYLFPYIGKFGLSSDEFCTRLLYEQKLAVVPGEAFGDCGEGYVRISYAYSIESIKEALARLEMFVNTL